MRLKKRNQFMVKTDAEWLEKLGKEGFDIMRRQGTERPFSGAFWDYFEKGKYKCLGCGKLLFASDDKFNSKCGWPSFSDFAELGAITEHVDESHGMRRIEVRCSGCDSHLGHLFSDGPTNTGARYCINSVCLDFDKE
jgi:peptide-methionine (R)-S-oxide reductase